MPSAADKWRGLTGAAVVVVGLVVVAGVFAGTIWKFGNANQIVAIVGSVTGVVGTIVTAPSSASTPPPPPVPTPPPQPPTPTRSMRGSSPTSCGA